MARPHPHKRVARAAAICILTFIATLAAIWLAPRASDAVAAWVRTPGVRTQTSALSAALPVAAPRAAAGASARSAVAAGEAFAEDAVTVDPGLRFNLVGVVCRPPAEPGGVVIQVRTSLDGSSWGDWYSASLEVVAEGDGSQPQAFTEPLWTGAARYVQVAARQAGGRQAAPVALHGVKVVALNSTEDADPGATLLGVVRRTAAAVAGLELAAPAGAMTTTPGHRDARRVGRRRVAALGRALVRHREDGLRSPHRQRQRLLAGRGAGHHAGSLRLSHAVAALERHRLQLPRRPLRDHLRGSIRWHDEGRHRGPGPGLQHRQYGHLGDRHVQHGCAPGCGGDGARTPPGLEAGRAPRRPRRQGRRWSAGTGRSTPPARTWPSP